MESQKIPNLKYRSLKPNPKSADKLEFFSTFKLKPKKDLNKYHKSLLLLKKDQQKILSHVIIVCFLIVYLHQIIFSFFFTEFALVITKNEAKRALNYSSREKFKTLLLSESAYIPNEESEIRVKGHLYDIKSVSHEKGLVRLTVLEDEKENDIINSLGAKMEEVIEHFPWQIHKIPHKLISKEKKIEFLNPKPDLSVCFVRLEFKFGSILSDWNYYQKNPSGPPPKYLMV